MEKPDTVPNRNITPVDTIIANLDRGLRTLAGAASTTGRPNPAREVEGSKLSRADRRHAAGLVRVDHAGEVAAQALYHGQALTARDAAVRDTMQQAALEEGDHLAWCDQRLSELGSRPSYFNPLWYLGSFMLGAAAGAAGDRWSLGFLAETERQVEEHLQDHMARLPAADERSRAILDTMRDDEVHHATVARAAGALELPAPIKGLMSLVSKVMTRTAYYF